MENKKKFRIIGLSIIIISFIILLFISPLMKSSKNISVRFWQDDNYIEQTFTINKSAGEIEGEGVVAKFSEQNDCIYLTFENGATATRYPHGEFTCEKEFEVVARGMCEAIESTGAFKVNAFKILWAIFAFIFSYLSIFKTETMCRWSMRFNVENYKTATPSRYLYYGTMFGGVFFAIMGFAIFFF